MKNLYIFLVFILLFSSIDVFSQKHFNNWYFRDKAGLTFNTPSGEPEALLDGALDNYPHDLDSYFFGSGCSTISDNDGNLLFYTDGIRVWNRLHQLMTNGEKLRDSIFISTTIIVPKPGNNCIYYIFTSDYYGENEDWYFLARNGFNYSIVDLSQENGLGAVSQKNIHLSDSVNEIAAVGHKNGKDVWIVTQNVIENCFNSYLLTENGLNSEPVKSPTNIEFYHKFEDSMYNRYSWNYWYFWNMKFSSDGKRLGFISLANDSSVYINLCDFNDETGEINKGIQILENKLNSDIEFADKGQFLYVTSALNKRDTIAENYSLYQFDITTNDPNIIENSKTLISDLDSNFWYCGLQMGPNKKIYLISEFHKYLSVINKPDLLGTVCDFRLNSIDLQGRYTEGFFPTVVQHYVPKNYRCIFDVFKICEGDNLYLFSNNNSNNDYFWTGPLNFTSSVRYPVIVNSTLAMSGTYYYTISRNDSTIFYDSIDVIVSPREKILFADTPELIINAQSYDLKAVENPIGTTITWYGINSNENVVTITQSGTYKVIVENQFGCKDSATVNIKLYPAYCEGETIFLSANYFKDDEFSWTGPLGFTSSVRNPEIANSTPQMSGIYNYKITRNGVLIIEGSNIITVNPKEKILFAGSPELILSAKFYKLKALADPIGAKFTWYGINSNENDVIITQSGKYKVIVVNKFGCIDSATFSIKLYPAYCEGDTIFLKPDFVRYAKYFLWSGPNGFVSNDSIPIIPDSKANMSGDYKVRIITVGAFEGEIDTIYTKIPVIVNLRPKILFSEIKEITLCQDSLELQAVDNPEGCKFSWKGINSSENKAVIKNAGIYTVFVENEFGCIDSATIEIKKYKAELVSDTENFSFNELCIGSSETKNVKLTLKSDYDLTINNIYFKSNMFIINNVNSLLKTYKDGETFDLPVSFKPSDAGEFYDTLVIESGEPCHYKKEIPVYGSSKALFQFSLPNIISEAGDYLMIPINAGMTCLNSDRLNSDYEIEISFDKEYFMPDSVKFGNIIDNKIVGQIRIMKIKGITEFNEKSDSLFPINYIYGMALAGRKEIIPLTIDSVNFTNSRYYPEFVNGSIKIEGCVINIRPIQMFKPTTLSIAPNPTDGDIKMTIESQEKGSFKIEIFDIQGQSIYSKVFTKSNSNFEEFEFNFDTQEMGSGVYSVHLTSPWNIIKEQLVISK